MYAPFLLKDYGKAKHERTDTRITFLGYGNIRRYKRLDVLIDATERAYAQVKIPFRVIIAGSSDNWSEYQKHIIHQELFDTRIGRIPNEDIPELFVETDYVVMPYESIAQSGAMMVAMNYETVWFLKKVYPTIKNICELTVAGFKPNDEVKQCCQENGVRLVDSPDDMGPYFRETEMVLAPIFDGGGMKVKIAEALSYALPVVTTDHGNIGYDLVDRENGLIANTAQDFISDIQFYYGLSNEARSEILQNSWRTYTEKFSLNAAVKQCDRIVKKLVQ